MAYLDFKEISERIKFKDLLDKLGIPYTEDTAELRGKFDDGLEFVVNKGKNLFFCPKDRETKGSVINFTACHFCTDLVGAAKQLTEHLFKPGKEPEREIPNLKLHYSPIINKMGISIDVCRDLEFGLVKERSVMAGKIAFTIHDQEGNKVGYIGWTEKQGWYFPKGHKQNHLYNLHRVEGHEVTLVADPFEAVKLHIEGHKVIALLSSSMTEAQEQTIKSRFSHVIIRMKNPGNIINRLITECYVKIA